MSEWIKEEIDCKLEYFQECFAWSNERIAWNNEWLDNCMFENITSQTPVKAAFI